MHPYIRELIDLYQRSIRYSLRARTRTNPLPVVMSFSQRALTLVDTPHFEPKTCPTILMLCRNNNLTWDQIAPLHPQIKLALHTHHPKFDPREISTTLCALASLGFIWGEDDLLKHGMLNRTRITFKDFNEKDLSMTLHALAQLKALDETIIVHACNGISKLKTLTGKGCVIIHTSFVHYCLQDNRKWRFIANILPEGRLSTIITTSHEMLRGSTDESLLQKDVCNTLSSRKDKINFIEEAIIYCTIVDIYLPEYRAVIEVNGPFHFLPNGKFNIRSTNKQELLTRLGFKVINVNYQVWEKLSSEHEKRLYLGNLLHAHLGIKPDRPWTPLFAEIKRKTHSANLEQKTKPALKKFAMR